MFNSKNEKSYHFRGKWKNGDNLVICSYGSNKKDAFNKLIKAKKENKFIHRKNDNFFMTSITNEETYTKLRKKGYSHNESNILSVYGHTGYIVKNGKVSIN